MTFAASGIIMNLSVQERAYNRAYAWRLWVVMAMSPRAMRATTITVKIVEML